MDLGNHLFEARKKSGMSQEKVAEKMGVSRQTISKWELGETLPDIRQAKLLSNYYGLSLDELIDFDIDVQEIKEIIHKTDEEKLNQVDWTKTWGEKYPILLKYQEEVDLNPYKSELKKMLSELQQRHGYSKQDAFLVLKDILAVVWKEK